MEFPVKPRLAEPEGGPDQIMTDLRFEVLGLVSKKDGKPVLSPAVDALILKQPSDAPRITVWENYEKKIAGVTVASASMILQGEQVSMITLLHTSPTAELYQTSLTALNHSRNPLLQRVSITSAAFPTAQQQLVRIMPDKTVFLRTKPSQYPA